jgi:hypothetical protein
VGSHETEVVLITVVHGDEDGAGGKPAVSRNRGFELVDGDRRVVTLQEVELPDEIPLEGELSLLIHLGFERVAADAMIGQHHALVPIEETEEGE